MCGTNLKKKTSTLFSIGVYCYQLGSFFSVFVCVLCAANASDQECYCICFLVLLAAAAAAAATTT
ncbi:hypothetical protein BDB00DRAFT_322698 [Zychaea mexicana]|uniref:uncharacterized protein n=1 Tax=Zychaea mexicana TaxID=64656 RepID=UPI0022FE4114|nr:uncharacterized protein BDB00DRAFT_322698 [Zychaea mexicana]KAI9498855.1 hypothetical protein BDB00DRAFT_322698 [Zychaea mexicana]